MTATRLSVCLPLWYYQLVATGQLEANGNMPGSTPSHPLVQLSKLSDRPDFEAKHQENVFSVAKPQQRNVLSAAQGTTSGPTQYWADWSPNHCGKFRKITHALRKSLGFSIAAYVFDKVISLLMLRSHTLVCPSISDRVNSANSWYVYMTYRKLRHRCSRAYQSLPRCNSSLSRSQRRFRQMQRYNKAGGPRRRHPPWAEEQRRRPRRREE